jgi:acyl-homoserine-lactone acylase
MKSRLAGCCLLALSAAAGLNGCGRKAPELPDPSELSSHVIIRRDIYGIPHILADSEEAAAFGFGFAQAEDHAAEIGRRYLSARGEEARHFGEVGLAGDLAMAQFDNTAAARRAVETITPLYRRIISAYAAGVNRYVFAHRAELPSWMPEITAADVLAYTRSSAAESLAGPALLRRLREKYEGVPPAREGEENGWDDTPGSNALALGGSRTATGKPILLGNPHLQWGSLYWEAHVRVPGAIDFYGSTLPGIPVLRAGFNDRLGFVTTNNAPDLEDVFALRMDPQKSDHYLFDGESLPLQRREVIVQVRKADGTLRSESRTVWSSHLGAVVYQMPDRVFVVKSTRLDAFQYYEGFYVLSKARTLDQWLAALRKNFVPTSNFTYADVEGNILYVWNGRVPVRKDGGDYRLDVDAATSADLWSRLHDVDDYPRLLNPPGGYVQNANNPPRFVSARDPINMTRYPSYFERGPLALRPQLALDMLQSQQTFTVDDVIALKHSPRMMLAERVKSDLIEAVRTADLETRAPAGAPRTQGPAGSRTQEPADRLRSADLRADLIAGAAVLEEWDNTVSAGSRGAVLFQRFWDLYSRAAQPPFATPWSESAFATTPRGIGDKAAAVMHLAAAVRAVREQFGSERVAWGDVHRFRAGSLDLPGDGIAGAYGAYRVMTFEPVAGSTLRVAGHIPGRPSPVGFGDAWILLVDFSKPATAWSVVAYGQTARQDSPHSSDQLRLFASHKLRPAWYSEADIKQNLERSYRP